MALTKLTSVDKSVAKKLLSELPIQVSTVAEMETKSYAVGQVVETVGYYAEGDSGAARYLVKAAQAFDGYGDHELANGNIAVLQVGERLQAKQFGCVMDGTTLDDGAFAAVRAYAATTRRNVYLGVGKLTLAVQQALTGAAYAILGELDSTKQNGSNLPATSIIWKGGAEPMFTADTTWLKFEAMAIENQGTATDFIELISGSIGFTLKDMYFINGSGHTPFTRSCVRSTGNRLGYGMYSGIVCQGPAPFFIDIDGQGTGVGVTPITIQSSDSTRSLFESNGGNAMTVLNIKDESFDSVTIRDCTFNQQGNELTAVSTFDTPETRTIDVFTFENNEWDKGSGVGATNDVVLKLENVQNANINNNHWNGNGVINLIDARNTNFTSFNGNWWRSCSAELIKATADCRFNIGMNIPDLSNTRGVLASDRGVIPTVYSPTIFIKAEESAANTLGVYLIEPTDAANFTIVNNAAIGGYNVNGQMITVVVTNTTGAPLGNMFVSGSFELAGGVAFIEPADGFNRSITFYSRNTRFYELTRDTADIPNV